MKAMRRPRHERPAPRSIIAVESKQRSNIEQTGLVAASWAIPDDHTGELKGRGGVSFTSSTTAHAAQIRRRKSHVLSLY